MNKTARAAGAVSVVLAGFGLWIGNSSNQIGPADDAKVRVIAHGGVHQSIEALAPSSVQCAGIAIEKPQHDYLSNTLPSMKAAFAAGADIVTFDIHPTIDGDWAVFGDAELDCRSDGSGAVGDATMKYLKTLDVGHGYSADGGKIFPFRERFVGFMPNLEEVLIAFPDKAFYVNVFGGEKAAASLDRYIADQGAGARIWGSFSKQAAEGGCLSSYAALGWIGHMPKSCRNTKILVPLETAHWLWGWPHLFTKRMKDAGSDVILVHSLEQGRVIGIDDVEALKEIPEGFDGYIWTDKVQYVGPDIRQ